MRHLVLMLCLAGYATATCAIAAAQPPWGRIVDPASGAELTPEELARQLAGAGIAILGEVHDNPSHHERQAWLIGRLRPGAAAFEMVDEEDEAALAPGPGRLERLPDLLDWEASGWPDWALYRPVFAALGDAAITGGGVARPSLTQAIEQGASAAHGAGAEEAGLAEPLAPGIQAALEAEMIAAHCDALPAAMAPGMVEAQRLRDARLAAAALRAHETGGSPAVLVTGNGHARVDVGVPAYLARLAPGLAVLSLGQVELAADEVPPDRAELPYDFVWYSEPAEREDPCAGFESGG